MYLKIEIYFIYNMKYYNLIVTMSVTLNGKACPITNASDNDIAKIVVFKPFIDWINNVNKDGNMNITEIQIQTIDMFGPRIGFIKFKAIGTFNGKPIPGIIFMRGGSVAILVVLICEGNKYVVLIKQPRLPMGNSAFIEIVAGMNDGSDNIYGVAIKELEEETGIKIVKSNLIHLGNMVPSAGGCDEVIDLFVHTSEVTKTELVSLQGKCTGAINEDEQITTMVIAYDKVMSICNDAKVICAMFYYERM